MNDNDLDQRLHDHGTAWRETNHDRPGIDWDAVTTLRRPRIWLGVAGVSIAAAAIIVPLVFTVGGRTTSARPTTHPSPAPSSALDGAPLDFAAISKGSVTFVAAHGTEGVHPQHKLATALGVSADGRTAYGAYPESYCRTLIERSGHSRTPQGLPDINTTDVATIGGVAAATGMAVSPDGTKLALVTTPPGSLQSDAPGCAQLRSRPQQLVIVGLGDKSVTRYSGFAPDERLGSLQWAPDSRRLALQISSTCASCHTIGTHIVDTGTGGFNLSKQILPLRPGHSSTSYGPVFWWHGELVTMFKGSLMRIQAHGRLHQITGNFPMHVDTVSSDPTGNHLLLTSGATTYRWDNGHLSVVKGHWTQPGW